MKTSQRTLSQSRPAGGFAGQSHVTAFLTEEKDRQLQQHLRLGLHANAHAGPSRKRRRMHRRTCMHSERELAIVESRLDLH